MHLLTTLFISSGDPILCDDFGVHFRVQFGLGTLAPSILLDPAAALALKDALTAQIEARALRVA